MRADLAMDVGRFGAGRFAPVALLLAVAAFGCSSGQGGPEMGDAGTGGGEEGESSPTRSGIGDGEIEGSGGGGSGAGGRLEAASPMSAGSAAGSSTDGTASGSTGSATVAPVPDGGAPSPEPGQLTAGAWDDNRNYKHFLSYREEVHGQTQEGLPPLSEAEHDAAHEKFAGDRAANTKLDITLVIDTTGSMGDELEYLQAEFDAISQTIEELYPDSDQRWALVVYRDTSDAYVVRWFDFRREPEMFREKLRAQSATGGGDFPEAADQALETMNQLAWRTAEEAARLGFWVADAPHHKDKASVIADAITTAADQGIHIYPVASSGIDERTELTMRSAAQLTGGRYVFLTDDSGIGGAHKEPSIPCYFVTHLDEAVLRMVDIEMSGMYRVPESENVIRTVGNPDDDGTCTLSSGDTVEVF